LRFFTLAFCLVAAIEVVAAALGRPVLFLTPLWFAMTVVVGVICALSFRRLPAHVFSGGTLWINQLRQVVPHRTYLAVAWSTLVAVCAILALVLFGSAQAFSIAFPVMWLAFLVSALAIQIEEAHRGAST
jgi:hypothetical protein